MHVDEDLAEAAIVVLAGAQVHLVPADDGLLGVALAAVGHLLAIERMRSTRSITRSTIFSATCAALARRPGRLHQRLQTIVLGIVVLIGDQGGEFRGCDSFEPSR